MNMEIRNDSIILKGYINGVERESRVLNSPQGKFVEVVKAGVWQRALDKAEDVEFLFNHDADRKLGSIKAGNVELREDNIGLYGEFKITDKEVIGKAHTNKLVGFSFGFKSNKQSYSKNDNGIDKRSLEDITLFEVSLLDNLRTPAYFGTSIIESRSEGNSEEILVEHRFIDSEIEVIEKTEPQDDVQDENNKVVEERDVEQNKIAYELLNKEIEILKLKH
ncbi:HK97 family phage prohead protease [Clostridium gasigenes]|uniref:HK97 family phage prohead protease n=1 Tax=Clostridium gasigenes TaxID=94869 RepID=UPI001FAE28E7|nr:HK97 family phage prohead protease [Clostridium gasigenes]